MRLVVLHDTAGPFIDRTRLSRPSVTRRNLIQVLGEMPATLLILPLEEFRDRGSGPEHNQAEQSDNEAPATTRPGSKRVCDHASPHPLAATRVLISHEKRHRWKDRSA